MNILRRKELENWQKISIKFRPELKIASFLCHSIFIKLLILIKLIYLHIFAFLNFWFWENKRFFGFFVGHKVKSFQKILKKHHTGELHKKGTILHQVPLITFFLTHPVCIKDRVYILHFHTRCVFCTTLYRVEFSVLLYMMNLKCPWVCTVYCVLCNPQNGFRK